MHPLFYFDLKFILNSFILNWAPRKVSYSLVSSIHKIPIGALCDISFRHKILVLKEFMFRYPITWDYLCHNLSIGFAQNFGNHLINLKECPHSLVVRYAQPLKFPQLKNLLQIVLFILFTKLPVILKFIISASV